MVCKQTLK